MESILFLYDETHGKPVEFRIVSKQHHNIAVRHLGLHILPFETLPLHIRNLMASESHLYHLLPVERRGIGESGEFRTVARQIIKRLCLEKTGKALRKFHDIPTPPVVDGPVGSIRHDGGKTAFFAAPTRHRDQCLLYVPDPGHTGPDSCFRKGSHSVDKAHLVESIQTQLQHPCRIGSHSAFVGDPLEKHGDISSHGGYSAGEVYHRHILGVYDLLERLLERFPHLLLEGCSGGGGRFDAAMLYYSPQIWCSDNTDAVNRLSIQYGTSFFYPVSAVGSHVSAVPNHQTGRSVPFRTRGHVALAGSFGYELDLNRVTQEEQEQVKEQIAQFHEYYELTHTGSYYRLSEPAGRLCAWAFVDERKDRALVTLVMTSAEGNPAPVHLKVKGLDPDRQYRCSLSGAVRSGRTWMNGGLTLPWTPGEYESLLILFEGMEVR